MIPPGSRYEQAEHNFAEAHVYDQYGYPMLEVTTDPGTKRYFFTVESRETLYLVTALPLPPSPPTEYFIKDTEDFQFLAYRFLRDPRRWWELADSNLQIWYPLDAQMGDYIRVPT